MVMVATWEVTNGRMRATLEARTIGGISQCPMDKEAKACWEANLAPACRVKAWEATSITEVCRDQVAWILTPPSQAFRVVLEAVWILTRRSLDFRAVPEASAAKMVCKAA